MPDAFDHVDRHRTRRRQRCPACLGRCGVTGGGRNDCRIGQYDTLANLGLIRPRRARFNVSTLPVVGTQPLRPGRYVIADLTPTDPALDVPAAVGEQRLFEAV